MCVKFKFYFCLPLILSLRKVASPHKLLTFSLLPLEKRKGFHFPTKRFFPRPSSPRFGVSRNASQLSYANDAFYADEFITFCFGWLSSSFQWQNKRWKFLYENFVRWNVVNIDFHTQLFWFQTFCWERTIVSGVTIPRTCASSNVKPQTGSLVNCSSNNRLIHLAKLRNLRKQRNLCILKATLFPPPSITITMSLIVDVKFLLSLE